MMFLPKLPSLALLLVLLVSATHAQKPEIHHGDDMCIWQGECDPSLQVQDGHYNCFYNGPPIDLFKEKDNHTELYQLIQETCPMYLQPGKGKVCCDKAQMVTLSTQTKLPRQLFARCPACYRNFLDHFCIVACDPDMSTFMDVQPDHLLYDTDIDKWYITQLEIYVSEEYAEELYDSCKDVRYPQASTKVVYIMCGSVSCDPHKWLKYLGNPGLNHFAPFFTNYHFGPKVPEPNMTALSFDFIPCNSSDSGYSCNRLDCGANCSEIEAGQLWSPTGGETLFKGRSDPLPRKEVLFITAPYEKNFTVIPIGVVGGKWSFGPVFNLEVLEEVLSLQQRIFNLVVTYTDPSTHAARPISLPDICLMASENEHCVVLSVLNYFQNDLYNLRYTEDFGLTDYTTQIHYCTRDPTNPYGYFNNKRIPCLGSFGGPVDPKVALNGYNFTRNEVTCEFDYDTAIALVVTIPVETEGKEGMVQAWEEGLTNLLATYRAKHISISFATE